MNRHFLLQAVLMGWTIFSFHSSPGVIADTGKTSLLSKYPLLSWARKMPVEIGCMLEKEFSYRDKIFNCNYKNYVNKGDPCNNASSYYEGIKFPIELAPKIHASIKEINLEFEHGNLREISITFKDNLSKTQIQQMFNLPASGTDLPDDIMEISYGKNQKPSNPDYIKWLTITCFEHMGAGDIDCN